MIVPSRRGDRVVHGGEEGDVGAGDLPGELGRRPPAQGCAACRRGSPASRTARSPRGRTAASRRRYSDAPRIEDKLSGVGLHLGEVRAQRPVEREVVGDAPLHVGAELRVLRVAREAVGGRRPLPVIGHDRVEVEHQPAVQPGQPKQVSRLPEERGGRALRRRPRVFEAAALHLAQHVDSPRLRSARLVLEALEGNAHLDLVAEVGDVPLGLVVEVGADVGRLAPDPRRRRSRRRSTARSPRRSRPPACLTGWRRRPSPGARR